MTSGYQIPFSQRNFILKGEGKFIDNYSKIQELGIGNYSKVYRVQNKKTKELFACKELAKTKINNLTKFKNEINIMSKCDHPNIIKLYEVYEDPRYIELVMEQCLGGTLFDRLINKMEENDETFSEKEAARIFRQLMEVINYCHNQGICHRDLKMENILFVSNQENSSIKIIDFGLSQCTEKKKLVQYITGKGYETINMDTPVGTPHYISPEVLNRKYNQKCDIWSAGVILFTMLGGYFPFDGETDNDIYKAVKKKKFIFHEEEWKSISNEVKDLINHMLCDEDKRYSAADVLKHPWLAKVDQNKKGVATKINVKHLENYKNSCNFKKFVLTYMATRLKEKEIMELRRLFLDIDTNKDGTLSVQEIRKCLLKLNEEKHLNLNRKEIDEIFNSIDVNNSKRIEYTEFISAMLEESSYCKEERLIEIFRLLDKDGSGKISKSEIKTALNKENVNEQDLQNFIKKFDLNGDGEIDYYEFVTCMSENEKEEKQENKK